MFVLARIQNARLCIERCSTQKPRSQKSRFERFLPRGVSVGPVLVMNSPEGDFGRLVGCFLWGFGRSPACHQRSGATRPEKKIAPLRGARPFVDAAHRAGEVVGKSGPKAEIGVAPDRAWRLRFRVFFCFLWLQFLPLSRLGCSFIEALKKL